LSSGPRDGAPTPEPRVGGGPDPAGLVRDRGEPLLDALERHRPGAREHADGVAAYAFACAVEIGLDRAGAEEVREVARLHEVGQVYVAADVLAGLGAVPSPERAAAHDAHYEAGYRLALGAGVPEPQCAWLLRARERFDGGGPEGLAGDAIALGSRIIRAACLCQTTLATATAAAPGGAAAGERAVEALRGRAGSELDQGVVDALVTVIERATGSGPRGT
jgi:HD-GYP domain-containing protein (c-di-GMP phosphodiesterase class II)